MGSSCSDDEDTHVDTALLTGIWQLMSEYDSEDDEWIDRSDEPDYMLIHEDHYGYKGLYSPTDRNEYDRFTWSCSGNRFSLRYDDEGRRDKIFVIEKLTDEELLWRIDCYEDGYHWSEKELYKRYNP